MFCKRYVLFSIIIVVICVILKSTGSQENNNDLIKRLSAQIDGNENIDNYVKVFVKEILLKICSNPIFVQLTEFENSRKFDFERIKELDRLWTEADTEIPIFIVKTGNICGKEAAEIVRRIPAIKQVLVMDNRGCNVGQNYITNDYWQGDESKWQQAFNSQLGGIEITEVVENISDNSKRQQASLPLINNSGKVIGAVSFVIDVPLAETIGRLLTQFQIKQNISPPLQSFIKDHLLALSMNHSVVGEIARQNQKATTIDELKLLDKQWIDPQGSGLVRKTLMTNNCSAELEKIMKRSRPITNLFVMDDKGGCVGKSGIARNFYNGDKPLWYKAFTGGGYIYIEPLSTAENADVDTKAGAFRISMPAIAGDGQIIGVFCFDVSVDLIQTKPKLAAGGAVKAK